jgi:hypothetical protein
MTAGSGEILCFLSGLSNPCIRQSGFFVSGITLSEFCHPTK